MAVMNSSQLRASSSRRWFYDWLCLRRAHWGIETGSDYCRDVTFKEDALRMTVGDTGKVVACIHNLVISLIKQAAHDNIAQVRRY